MAWSLGAKRSVRMLLKELKAFRQPRHGYSSRAFTGELETRSLTNLVYSSSLPLRRFSATAVSSTDQMSLIRQLRERTSAPMKDVKSALVSCNWDIEAAHKDLRKRGAVVAAKMASRTATEGLLAIAQNDNRAVVVELNCQTDFVARNDLFRYLASSLANTALSIESSAQKTKRAFSFGREYFENMKIKLEHPKLTEEITVQGAVTEVSAMFGEKVEFSRGFALSTSSHGLVSSYLHACPEPGFGRIAGLLTLEVEDANVSLEVLQQVGPSLAMQIVASNPLFLSKELVTSEALDNELEILKAQAESSGKPQAAIEKMVQGRLRKYFEEVVFLEQKFMFDDSINVKLLLEKLSKEVGSCVTIGNFVRMEVGEIVKRLQASEAPDAAAEAE